MKKIYVQTIVLFGFGLSLAGCSNSSTNNNVNPPVKATNTMTINEVINYGIGTNGQISIELDGSFLGSGDNVSIICSTNIGPSHSVVSDSKNQIFLELPPMTDSCTFQVQNSGQTSDISTPIALSDTQDAIGIKYAYDRNTVGPDDKITLYGRFTGSDDVWSSCDGASQFSQVTNVSLNNSNEIDFLMPAPISFNSCQFFVAGNTVQSPIFDVLSINTVLDNGLSSSSTDSITLKGLFVGDGNDVVYSSCDGATGFTSTSNFVSDTTSQIDISILTPKNFASCQFYVANNQVQSNTYSILFIQGVYELTFTSTFENFVVEGVFSGFNDQVWAACDGDSFTQYGLSLDSESQLKFAMPTPTDVSSCQMYVQNGTFQTPIYSLGNLPTGIPLHSLNQTKLFQKKAK